MNRLTDQLKAYSESDAYPFHMPGHKRQSLAGALPDWYRTDITEIDGFDDLHHAEGILQEAQQRAAALYRSEETHFLINGSTCGILTAISAVAGEGKLLLMARNCHKSVYHGAMLSRMETAYLMPEQNEAFGILGAITPQQVINALQGIVSREQLTDNAVKDRVAAVLVTSPTYDGVVSDIRGICVAAHRYGIPVIVDQAHGAHFGLHPAFPESAIACGADLVIHSLHKTLPSPTQTALLHVNGSLVRRDLIRKFLAVYETSSPSYLLMSGMDDCISLLLEKGSRLFDPVLQWRQKVLDASKDLRSIRIAGAENLSRASQLDCTAMEICGTRMDPLHLLISVKGSGRSGAWLMERLRRDAHLELEMAAYDYCIALLSPLDTEEGLRRLAVALQEADAMLMQDTHTAGSCSYGSFLPEQACTLHRAFAASETKVPLTKAGGSVSAAFVNLYPPGIPILAPGERIDCKTLSVIEDYRQEGFTVQGIDQDASGEAVICCMKM